MKRQVMTSIDENIHKEARERNFNISEILEEELKKRLRRNKSNYQILLIKCSRCTNEVTEGFLCRTRGLVLCNDCQGKFNMDECPHEIIDGVPIHEHIKFPGYGEKNIDVILEVEKIQEIDEEKNIKKKIIYQEAKDFVNAFKKEILEQIK